MSPSSVKVAAAVVEAAATETQPSLCRGRILLCFYGSLFCWLALTGWLAGMCNNTQHGTEAEVH